MNEKPAQSASIDDGGPAFPCDSRDARQFAGMSLRAYLAGQAMVGLLASDDNEPCISRDPEGIAREIQEHMDNKAKAAVRYADALIVALKANGGAA